MPKRRKGGDKGSLEAYFKEVGKYKELTRDEEEALARRIKEGDEEAKMLLAQSNLKFVIEVASHYKQYGVPFFELISEGNVGLMKAIDLYDVDKGVKFITYGVWWIREAISRKVREASKRDSTEICRSKLSDYSYYDEDNDEILDRRDYRNSVANPDDEEGEELKREVISDIISHLEPLEARIIVSYFGIGNAKETLEEIGESESLTKERIRQIKEKALRKMRSLMVRHPQYASICVRRSYLEEE